MRSLILSHDLRYSGHRLPEDYSDSNGLVLAEVIAFDHDFACSISLDLHSTKEAIDELIKNCESLTSELLYTNIKNVKQELMCWVYHILDKDTIVGCLAINRGRNGSVWGRLHAKDTAIGKDIYSVLESLFPAEKTTTKPTTVPIRFWSNSSEGATYRSRQINTLEWDHIGVNYHPEVSVQIDALMNLRPPMDAGKIMLWHGVPGTGKSSAIRSLSQAWFPWCDTAYIVDPERFFGDSQYMMTVILDSAAEDYDWEEDVPIELVDVLDTLRDNKQTDESLGILKGDNRWRVLLLEDADEFITADAKDRTGQALSRLLNLGDGIIGQGLNFITLITTNEPMNKIHPAVAREGRSLANLHFLPFDVDQARSWFKNKTGNDLDTSEHGNGTWTLAQLYEAIRKQKQIKTAEEKSVYTGQYL